MSKLNRRETRTLVLLFAVLGLTAATVLLVGIHGDGEVSMTFNFTLAVMVLAGFATMVYWAMTSVRHADARRIQDAVTEIIRATNNQITLVVGTKGRSVEYQKVIDASRRAR